MPILFPLIQLEVYLFSAIVISVSMNIIVLHNFHLFVSSELQPLQCDMSPLAHVSHAAMLMPLLCGPLTQIPMAGSLAGQLQLDKVVTIAMVQTVLYFALLKAQYNI